MSTIPTTSSSLQSAYDTWSSGLVTTSAGTLAWGLRCVQVVYRLLFVMFAVFPFYTHASFFIPLIRNLFTSAIRSCWRSELSCRREWMSCSGRWPTARRRLPPSVRAPPHAPSLQYRPLFDTDNPNSFCKSWILPRWVQEKRAPNRPFGDTTHSYTSIENLITLLASSHWSCRVFLKQKKW